MHKKEIISKYRVFFRELRKSKYEGKNMKELVEIEEIPWATASNSINELINYGFLVKQGNSKKILINSDIKELFVGVYISCDCIYISVIDILGKEVYFENKKLREKQGINKFKEFYNILEEMLKSIKLDEVKCIVIASDEYIDMHESTQKINENFCLPKNLIKEFDLPKEIEIYYAKTCVTNSWKWYDENDITDDKLNVIISFSEDNCYYTIMKNAQIIQKILLPNVKLENQNFFKEIIMPIWKSINPDNIIFITSSEEQYEFVRKNKLEWNYEIMQINDQINKKFERRDHTKLIISKQSNIYKGVATYAMYRYYNWANS